MIRIYIPGFTSADNEKEGPRFGDGTVFVAEYVDVIDGYCGIGTTRLIKFLKDRNYKQSAGVSYRETDSLLMQVLVPVQESADSTKR